ncbi:MAG: hypothetical protein PWQ74_386 [Methanobacteriaceae archaeon]|jgi:hypothetical protein|nr:hypothetical protein [Methanobacteriaceae archaeon]
MYTITIKYDGEWEEVKKAIRLFWTSLIITMVTMATIIISITILP